MRNTAMYSVLGGGACLTSFTCKKSSHHNRSLREKIVMPPGSLLLRHAPPDCEPHAGKALATWDYRCPQVSPRNEV